MYEKYFNKLREECLIRNRSSRTADTYINNIHHFMKWTGYKSMEDLSLQDARSFILEKRNSGLSSATCNFYNSSICFLYKHVLHIPWDQDIVPRMRLDVKLPKEPPREQGCRLFYWVHWLNQCPVVFQYDNSFYSKMIQQELATKHYYNGHSMAENCKSTWHCVLHN